MFEGGTFELKPKTKQELSRQRGEGEGFPVEEGPCGGREQGQGEGPTGQRSWSPVSQGTVLGGLESEAVALGPPLLGARAT